MSIRDESVYMRVSDLQEAIRILKLDYPEDYLDFKIAVEHHPEAKECSNCKDHIINDGEGWEYVMCHGFNTTFPKEKIFTINIHY